MRVTQSIRRGLVKSGMGGAEINVIMRGEFWPGLASKELIKEVMMEMRNEDKQYSNQRTSLGRTKQVV